MTGKINSRAALLGGIALSALIASPVAAQQSPANVSEVVVTAQRVEQNLQDVPVAVTAFSSASLKANNVENVQDLALRTPGLSVTSTTPANPSYSIRGVGSPGGISQNAAGDASVIVFVDGVYAGKGSVPDIDAMDLERVEVLRGPQGTLYGKNAVGGLINFISKKPTKQTSLDVQGTLGNYDRMSVSAHGNVPLSDQLYASAGFTSKQRSGFTYNATTGNWVNDEKLWAAHAALRYLPNDKLDIVLRGDLLHQDQKGDDRDNNCDTTFQGGIHCVGVDPNPRIVNAWTDGFIRRDLRTISAEVNYETRFGVLTSLTAYRAAKYSYLVTSFSNPINPPAQIESTAGGDEDNRQFSQELRLAIGGKGDRLRGQVGLYYLNEHNKRTEMLNQAFAIPAITGIGVFPQDVHADSFAVFGQGDYDILPTLTATVGARMTWEKKKGRFQGFKVPGSPGNPPPLSGPYDVSGSDSWEAFTPRVALNWKASEAINLYASAARGYKSGGFQGIAGNVASAPVPYNPEFAWSYELGAKTQWLDRRLTLNLAIFKTDYNDLQVSTLVPLCCVVVSNAATATTKGFEAEFVLNPVEHLVINGSYAYLDAKFGTYISSAGNFSGHQVPRSPKNKFNIGAQYELLVGDWSFRPRVDYSWIDKSYFNESNAPQFLIPSHPNLDARLAANIAGSNWEIAVWGKNLTDELVPTYIINYPPNRQVLDSYEPPRTYGVTLSFKM